MNTIKSALCAAFAVLVSVASAEVLPQLPTFYTWVKNPNTANDGGNGIMSRGCYVTGRYQVHVRLCAGEQWLDAKKNGDADFIRVITSSIPESYDTGTARSASRACAGVPTARAGSC